MLMEYEFGDGRGNVLRMWFDMPIIRLRGKWRALDHGYIRYNSGRTLGYRLKGTGPDDDIRLINNKNKWGIELYEFYSFFGGFNNQGRGLLVQGWSMKLKPGTISWVRTD